MANSIAPAFVKIDYTSRFGPHSMSLPCVPILTGPAGGAGDQFQLRGAALPVEVDGAVKDFVAILKPFFPSTTTFINYTCYQLDDPEGPARPVISAPLNIVGTDTSSGWDKATQRTWTFRTDEFGTFKLVFLDVRVADFDKVSTFVEGTVTGNLIDYVTADVTWLAGRDGGRPNTFLQLAMTLNEKLRRSYRMN